MGIIDEIRKEEGYLPLPDLYSVHFENGEYHFYLGYRNGGNYIGLVKTDFPVTYPLCTIDTGKTLLSSGTICNTIRTKKFGTLRKKIIRNKRDNPLRIINSNRPSRGTREQVKKRDGCVCLKCGDNNYNNLVVDHIKPLGIGGTNRIENLQTLCRECDKEKGCKEINYRHLTAVTE